MGRVGRGTDTCVYVLLQCGDQNRSALHYASSNGLESVVAKLLSLGADPALMDKVRACSYMNMCKSSVYVCTFVNAWRMRISHVTLVCTCNTTLCVCVYMCPCVCRYTHTQRGILTHAHAESNVSYVDDTCMNT